MKPYTKPAIRITCSAKSKIKTTHSVNKHCYDAHDMQQNFCMDNVISGCGTEEEAVQYHNNTSKFNLGFQHNRLREQQIMISL